MAKTALFTDRRGFKKRVARIKLKGNWPPLLELILGLLALGLSWFAVWWAATHGRVGHFH